MSKMKTVLLAAAAAIALPSSADAALVYVGSWQVDQGPFWGDQPLAYTGQEAAALLFGGNAANYVISTAGANPGDANHKAWYSIIGYYPGVEFGEDYSSKYLGQYYGPSSDYPLGDITASASAYVWDNAQGSDYTNYAFRIDGAVPEPASWALMIGGFALAGSAMRRRKAAVAFA